MVPPHRSMDVARRHGNLDILVDPDWSPAAQMIDAVVWFVAGLVGAVGVALVVVAIKGLTDGN